MTVIARFVAELRAAPGPIDCKAIDEIADYLETVEVEANENGEALEYLDGLKWILRQRVSLIERLNASTEYMGLGDGKKVRVNLRRRNGHIVIRRIP